MCVCVCVYIYVRCMKGGVVRYGHGDSSSNPGLDCLYVI